MGATFHELSFVRYLANKAPLEDTLTVGRHWMLVNHELAEQIIGRSFDKDVYCDTALRALGATDVQTIDNSDYEGARLVADLNLPFESKKKFNTILDFGSLEHIWNIPNALGVISSLLSVGGRIVHVLPANNLAGHGFWQFCSDLFYEIYSPAFGFEDTEVYYASSFDHQNWYRVKASQLGERKEFISIEPIIIIVSTRKVRSDTKIGESFSQPFYRKSWEAGHSNDLVANNQATQYRYGLLRKFLKQGTSLYRLLRNAITIFGLLTGRSSYSLSGSQFEAVNI